MRHKRTSSHKISRQKGSAISASHKRIIRKIQEALSLDLLHSDYAADKNRDKEKMYEWATKGHCYVATEAAYHMFARHLGFVPYVLRHRNGGTHWWLVCQETGERLDPTEPQLGGEKFPYRNGRRAVFLTKKPSKRTAELIRRVRDRSIR
jgi:hypothetical protein